MSAQFGNYRWTSDCVSARVEELGDDAEIEIRYRCGAEAEREAWLTFHGARRVLLPCGADEPQTLRLLLDRAQWGGEPFLPVDVEVSPAFRPAEIWGIDDSRELGLQLISLVARSRAGTSGVTDH